MGDTEILTLPQSYPWSVSMNAYQCLMYLADLERKAEEKILTEHELLYYAYLSFIRNTPIRKILITDCYRYCTLNRLPFIYLMGIFYQHGYCGIRKNLRKALKMYERLAEKRFQDALIPYYSLSLRNTSSKRELSSLLIRLMKEEMTVPIQRMISYCFLKIGKREQSSIESLKKLEQNEDMLSSYFLGLHYLCKKDYSNAFSHFAISAEKGHLKSKTICGVLALNGKGIEKDELLALSYFLSAKDCAYSLSESSRILMNHPELSQDLVYENYRKAYEKGYVKAGIPLAIYYLSTFGEYEKGKKIIKELETKYKMASSQLRSLLKKPILTDVIQKLC